MNKLRKIAVASDHAGYELKEQLKAFLKNRVEVLDLGTDSTKPVDYPDFAHALAKVVVSKEADKGILLCGSGVGASIAANKVKGARAGLCHDTYSAHQGVEHDHINILVLGARIVGVELAKELVAAFLHAKESQEERYVRRIQKLEP